MTLHNNAVKSAEREIRATESLIALKTSLVVVYLSMILGQGIPYLIKFVKGEEVKGEILLSMFFDAALLSLTVFFLVKDIYKRQYQLRKLKRLAAY